MATKPRKSKDHTYDGVSTTSPHTPKTRAPEPRVNHDAWTLNPSRDRSATIAPEKWQWGRVHFLTTWMIGLLKSASADMVVNVVTFGERGTSLKDRCELQVQAGTRYSRDRSSLIIIQSRSLNILSKVPTIRNNTVESECTNANGSCWVLARDVLEGLNLVVIRVCHDSHVTLNTSGLESILVLTLIKLLGTKTHRHCSHQK